LNESCDLMSAKAFVSESGEVPVGNASSTALGLDWRRELTSSFSGSGRRARRATARLPWDGWERMRAMPAPCLHRNQPSGVFPAYRLYERIEMNSFVTENMIKTTGFLVKRKKPVLRAGD
jgi:hypothetical protein